MYFNIKCIGKLPGQSDEFERSLMFERPKFDCKMLVFRARIHKLLVRKGKWEDNQKQSDPGLHCLSRPFLADN